MSPLPTAVWEEISIDFASVSGETLLVVVDDYSRYPLVEPVKSTAASSVIPKLDKIFALFGVPSVVKSDNGPPFNGEEFTRFSKVLGFRHRKVTPYWSRSNGEVERFIRTLRKAVRAAKTEGKNWRKELENFLRIYRTTPHVTTAAAPAEVFLGRTVRDKLPSMPVSPSEDSELRKTDMTQKAKMKHHADMKQYVRPSDLQVGDHVLVKQPFNMAKGNPFEPTPMVITGKKGTMITATDKDNGRSVTRNSSHFKPWSGGIKQSHMPTDSDYMSGIEPNEEAIIPDNIVSVPDFVNDSYSDPTPPSVIHTPPKPLPATPVVPVRRSGRTIQPPKWTKDYIMK
jgi:hypothetical protein